MIEYLVNQIVIGKLSYTQITTTRMDLKELIDEYIINNNIQINKEV